MRRTLSKVFVPVSAVLVGALPMVVMAQTGGGTTGALSNNVQAFLTNVNGWVNSLLVILFVAAIAAFFWGLIKYLWGSEQDHKKGLQQMGMGILALFVMASIWGLVGFMQGTLGIGAGHAPTVQSLQVN